MPTLYGIGLSPFVRKVRVVLAEKHVAYEHDPVVPVNVSPEYRKLSPLGKVPAYRDGDLALADSSVICAYLERTHPQPGLYPSDPEPYARALWFEEYADSKLVEAVGPVFFNRVVKRVVFKQEPDEALVRKALDETLPPLLDYLEGQLGEGEFLVGGRFSIADIAVATHFAALRLAGVAVDAGRWPKLVGWAERVLARPSFKGCLAEEMKLLGV
jgi:glutathione S-transferase